MNLMEGLVLDLVLVILVLLFAASGYRQGFIVGVLSFSGFLGGGVLAAIAAPGVIQRFVADPTYQAVIAIAVVFLCAAMGQYLTSYLGAVLRNRVTWSSARVFDALGGALVNVVAMLLVSWLVGSAVANSAFPVVTTQVNESRILRAVDRVMPDSAEMWFSTFRKIVDQSSFPQVFSGLGTGEPAEVSPPDPDALSTPEMREAGQSIVKVLGTAPECQRRVEGTGFVYEDGHIMTNAHVVAGVTQNLRVSTRSGQQLPADVVLFDPQQDIAVLNVPDLELDPLEFDTEARKGDDAVVAGFPRNNGFTVVPARVRAEQTAQGPDFYHSQQVSREIYQVRAEVRPGNSGGPLLSPDGTVYGVVFAAATNEDQTGYVLTADEVADSAAEADDATEPVSPGKCE